PEDQWRPPEQPGRPPRMGGGGSGGTPGRQGGRPRWMPWVIVGLIVAIFLFWQAAPSTTPDRAKLDYGTFLQDVRENKVASIKYDASSGKITGKFGNGVTEGGKSEFTAQGPESALPDEDIKLLNEHKVLRNYKPRSTDWLA